MSIRPLYAAIIKAGRPCQCASGWRAGERVGGENYPTPPKPNTHSIPPFQTPLPPLTPSPRGPSTRPAPASLSKKRFTPSSCPSDASRTNSLSATGANAGSRIGTLNASTTPVVASRSAPLLICRTLRSDGSRSREQSSWVRVKVGDSVGVRVRVGVRSRGRGRGRVRGTG